MNSLTPIRPHAALRRGDMARRLAIWHTVAPLIPVLVHDSGVPWIEPMLRTCRRVITGSASPAERQALVAECKRLDWEYISCGIFAWDGTCRKPRYAWAPVNVLRACEVLIEPLGPYTAENLVWAEQVAAAAIRLVWGDRGWWRYRRVVCQWWQSEGRDWWVWHRDRPWKPQYRRKVIRSNPEFYQVSKGKLS